jgi:hypothetical protein
MTGHGTPSTITIIDWSVTGSGDGVIGREVEHAPASASVASQTASVRPLPYL